MQRLLSFTLAIEVVIALFWTIAWSTERGSSGIAVLGWFTSMVVAYTIAFLIGAMVAWRRPSLRKRAAVVMVLPFIGGLAPVVLRTIAGGPLEPEMLRTGAVLVLAGLAVLAVLFPARAIRWLPTRLFSSRGWNLFLLAGIGIGWSVLIVLIAWLQTQDGHTALRAVTRTGTGAGAAQLVVLASLFVLAMGACSVLTGAWGWLGLKSATTDTGRRIHRLQVMTAIPGILVALATWLWLAGQR